ncbi:MAG: phosphoribosylformylglycinamidine synthase subunit PurL [Alphaproteobacteria bacterium]|nr:phosphoribosylformylglycinamidine synthase subunit PurL [Alphaproteobacteria bacterium]
MMSNVFSLRKDPSVSITPEVVAQHGLTTDEYQKILTIMGRDPNITELGIFSAMWNEHCSYKSTRLHLGKFPTKAEWVICGPGENAGIIDIGDNQAAIFKIESHNHPSFIEPFQGAATGVGGILRDVFTMGARPVALLNALRFGAIDNNRTRFLLSGVVSGISSYGNCMGIPTVGGECEFHESYNGNILVNAMAVGIADQDKIFYSAASAIGSSVVYVGAKTGRDGIHGATMASAGFDDKSEEKRPTVQVGDPFTEKLLLEACLELMATDAILAIQDMGAAGLTCSSLEMAGKGGTGIELNLEHIPTREDKMTPYELMLSESQERMLIIIKPEKQDEAKRIFEKWELDFAMIGTITDTGCLILKLNGEEIANLPVAPLSEQAPVYDRPHTPTPKRDQVEASSIPATKDLEATLLQLLATPDLAQKRWIWEQYDYQVMCDTVLIPGSDAAVVRVHETNNKGLAVVTDCTPRYCVADPYEGGKQIVVETYRNLVSVGAKPRAITNCLNFGNPQHPTVMGQIVGCIEGMAEACNALEYPVISGNVSLYNETNGKSIYPTPVVGGVGVVQDVNTIRPSYFKEAGLELFLLGTTHGHLGSSLYLREIEKREDGTSPAVDLATEKSLADFLLGYSKQTAIKACHDLSDGGFLIALTEMTLPYSIGVNITLPQTSVPQHAFLFGEDQGRYLVAVQSEHAGDFEQQANNKNLVISHLGKTGGDTLTIAGVLKVAVSTLKHTNENVIPQLMAA